MADTTHATTSPPIFDPRAGPLKVLIWNIQFCAGSQCHFFYEGGHLTSVPHKEMVVATIDTVAEVIARHDPDVVLLQEVDRGARRSWYIDEHIELCRRLPQYVSQASTWYWQVPWVPAPMGVCVEMLGRVDLHLSVLSKYAIGEVRREPLPLVKSDGFLGRTFNLRRAVQCVTLPAADGEDVTILHTHLSAFTNGDGTVEAQVDVLLSLVARAGRRWLIAGDFNAMPPGVSSEGLTGQAAIEYPVLDSPSPVTPLFDVATSVIPLAAMLDPERRAEHFTLKYYGKRAPEVSIDYLFLAPTAWTVAEARVAVDDRWPSDHAPIVATIECRTDV